MCIYIYNMYPDLQYIMILCRPLRDVFITLYNYFFDEPYH